MSSPTNMARRNAFTFPESDADDLRWLEERVMGIESMVDTMNDTITANHGVSEQNGKYITALQTWTTHADETATKLRRRISELEPRVTAVEKTSTDNRYRIDSIAGSNWSLGVKIEQVLQKIGATDKAHNELDRAHRKALRRIEQLETRLTEIQDSDKQVATHITHIESLVQTIYSDFNRFNEFIKDKEITANTNKVHK